jgi:transketolase N-terminal domain/subunit
MFQSIFFEKPVIVGCNPPMKDIVEKYGFEIVLKHDGNNIDDICNAISSLQKNIKNIKTTLKNKDKIT